jgi:hypothetical protein
MKTQIKTELAQRLCAYHRVKDLDGEKDESDNAGNSFPCPRNFLSCNAGFVGLLPFSTSSRKNCLAFIYRLRLFIVVALFERVLVILLEFFVSAKNEKELSRGRTFSNTHTHTQAR